jgi:hypothetical protein
MDASLTRRFAESAKVNAETARYICAHQLVVTPAAFMTRPRDMYSSRI